MLLTMDIGNTNINIGLFDGDDLTVSARLATERQKTDDQYAMDFTNIFVMHKIDFNDMINNATREVEKGHLNNKYKYILVDEYQDTSYTRYNLVKAIQDKTGAKVCVVGDDWQSIYRFTGCDVSLFTKFANLSSNSPIFKLFLVL